MPTYKDTTFCTAKDCGNLQCHRNINRPDFQPKPTDRISWMGFENCPNRRSINYKKVDEK